MTISTLSVPMPVETTEMRRPRCQPVTELNSRWRRATSTESRSAGDAVGPVRVAGQEDVVRHLAGREVDVVLAIGVGQRDQGVRMRHERSSQLLTRPPHGRLTLTIGRASTERQAWTSVRGGPPTTTMDAMGAVDPLLREIFDEHIATLERARDGLLGDVTDLASDLGDALERGGKLVVFGNGGSAADSQHFAAELVGRFNRPREPLSAMALTTDTSALTAIGNDFDYGEVFARQVRAHVREATSSWRSARRGTPTASCAGARRLARPGRGHGGSRARAEVGLADSVDRCLRVPSTVTARIQEVHITLIHAVCELVGRARREPGRRTAGHPETSGIVSIGRWVPVLRARPRRRRRDDATGRERYRPRSRPRH